MISVTSMRGIAAPLPRPLGGGHRSTPGSQLATWAAQLEGALRRYAVPVLVTAHVLIFTVIYLTAYLLRFDGAVPPAEWRLAVATAPLVAALKLVAFLLMRSHRGWCRYNTFADMVRVAEAATLGTAAVAVALFFYHGPAPVPRSVIVLDWAGTILLVGGLRGAIRLVRERYHPMVVPRSTRRALVVGACEAGASLVREIHSQPQLGLRVVGFLDPDRALRGRILAGVRVLGPPDDLRRLAARHQVQTVLIPVPVIPAPVVRSLVEACGAAGVKAQAIPVFNALLTGTLTVQPRDVDIEDLLYRDPVQLDGEAVGRLLRGRVVLVTGAAGSIGSEICRQVFAFRPAQVILLDHSENGLFAVEREFRALAPDVDLVPAVASIADAPRVRALLGRYRPAIVFHAAAHKHVPMMEANPGEAIKNNVLGTRILVDEAVRAGAEAFVMISTDKAVNPTSVMGACKRLAEMYVQALSEQVACRLVTVRFGNVLGSSGSVVPIFKEQIRKGGPVTVTHPEMVRYFMTIPEATQLVLQAGALGAGGEIFVLDMGEPVRVADLAHDLIRLSGLTAGKEIEVIYTGLRPGEKLYEELYDADEERIPTPHPKIFTAQHCPCSLERLRDQLDHLRRVVEELGEDEAIAALEALVPGYRRGGPRPPDGPRLTAQAEGLRGGHQPIGPVAARRCEEVPGPR